MPPSSSRRGRLHRLLRALARRPPGRLRIPRQGAGHAVSGCASSTAARPRSSRPTAARSVLVSRRQPDRLLRRRQAEAARAAGRTGADDLRRPDAAWRRLGTRRPDRLLPAFRAGLSIVPATGGAPQPLTTLDVREGEEPSLSGLPSRRRADPLPRPDGGGRRAQRRERHRGAGARERRAHPPHRRKCIAALLLRRAAPLLARRYAVRPAFRRFGSQAAGRAGGDRLAGRLHPERAGPRLGLERRNAALPGRQPRQLSLSSGSIAPDSASSRCARRSFSRTSPSPRRPTTRLRGHSAGQGATDLWVYDLSRDAASRLTFEEGGEDWPVWSSDGRFLYYASDRRNDGTIFRRASDGTGAPEEIATTPQGIWPLAASHDDAVGLGSVGGSTSTDIQRFDLATRASRRSSKLRSSTRIRRSRRTIAGSPTPPNNPVAGRSTSRHSVASAAAGRSRTKAGSARVGAPTAASSTSSPAPTV